ncbi:MAG: phosphatase PAP2 family protein [Geodermatophilaceae bacterium]|jgi:undecaprenyl-diphosphatase
MRPVLIAATVLAAVLGILAVLVGQDVRAVLDIDLRVNSALRYREGGSGWVEVLQVLTAPGLSVFRLVVLAPVATLLVVRGRPRVAGFVVLAALAVGPLTTLFKEVVGRVRPTADDPLVAAAGLSFPSGHSSGAAALAGILLVVLWPVLARRWRAWLGGGLVLLTLCVAWTRIALGVHYLSDVVAGMLLGAVVVLISMAVFGLYPGGPADVSGGDRPDVACRPS